MDLATLKAQIGAAVAPDLADELVDAYEELKVRYFRRDFRPGQLEAGRFAEAAWRILQHKAGVSVTPVGTTLPSVDALQRACLSADRDTVHESVRIHLPRALAAIYNVRNRRDVGHITADIDANSMDAEFVVAACNWVLAEFVRLFHQCSPEEARAYVDAIVKRRAPLVQVFGTTPFVLHPDLSVKDAILLLLYHQSAEGATIGELDLWTPSVRRATIHARVSELERNHRFVRRLGGRVLVTDSGSEYIESRILALTTATAGAAQT